MALDARYLSCSHGFGSTELTGQCLETLCSPTMAVEFLLTGSFVTKNSAVLDSQCLQRKSSCYICLGAVNLKAAYWADPSLYIKPFARWQLRMATDLCGDETEFMSLAIRCIT